jgi:peroxidase
VSVKQRLYNQQRDYRSDNSYYKLILEGKGLLNSDEVLWTGKDPEIAGLIKSYAENEPLLFKHYVNSIIKMLNRNPQELP